MMPIGDKTILEILLRQMKRAGINHVVLTVGHLAGLMQAFFQDGQQYDLDITYSYEAVPLGTAGPLAMVPNLKKLSMVSNGDVLTLLNFMTCLDFHRQQNAICTIACTSALCTIDLAWIEQNNGDYVITGYVEKPTLNYRVSMGIYIFEPRVLEYIPKISTWTSPTWSRYCWPTANGWSAFLSTVTGATWATPMITRRPAWTLNRCVPNFCRNNLWNGACPSRM
jgi:NDP-sugar pyrophosphorylase family protein